MLEEEGYEVECTIKINVEDQKMTAFDEFEVLLFRAF